MVGRQRPFQVSNSFKLSYNNNVFYSGRLVQEIVSFIAHELFRIPLPLM